MVYEEREVVISFDIMQIMTYLEDVLIDGELHYKGF
jgi:hypothetical protein